MELQDMIDASNAKMSALMALRDEVADGVAMYFETPQNNGILKSNDALVEAIEVLVDEHSLKHQELVKAIQKVSQLCTELDLY